jgi:hypothetical protein
VTEKIVQDPGNEDEMRMKAIHKTHHYQTGGCAEHPINFINRDTDADEDADAVRCLVPEMLCRRAH